MPESAPRGAPNLLEVAGSPLADPSSGNGAPVAGRRSWYRRVWLPLRLLTGAGTLVAVSLLVFAATTFVPGDAARVVAGRTASPEQLARVRADLGLDAPLWEQYLSTLKGFLGADGNLSLVTGQPVYDLVLPRLGATLLLLLIAAAISLPLSGAIGVLSVVRPQGVFAALVNAASIVLAALPEFVVGIALVLLLSTTFLHLLPAVAITAPGTSVLSEPSVLVLPVATLVLATLPYLTRQVRGAMLDALGSEYVVTALLKGLSARRVLLAHALRNALVPAIQSAALTLAYLLGGVVVIEFLFQYQGLGSALVDAVRLRDVPVLQTVTLVLATGYVLLNLLADVMTVYLTPRLRTS